MPCRDSSCGTAPTRLPADSSRDTLDAYWCDGVAASTREWRRPERRRTASAAHTDTAGGGVAERSPPSGLPVSSHVSPPRPLLGLRLRYRSHLLGACVRQTAVRRRDTPDTHWLKKCCTSPVASQAGPRSHKKRRRRKKTTVIPTRPRPMPAMDRMKKPIVSCSIPGDIR